MGVLYIVVPSDTQLRSWMEELGLAIEDSSDGRMPTTTEIRAALQTLTGFEVEYYTEEETCVATISTAANPQNGPWAVLAFPTTDAAEDADHLTFRKGWPEVMVPILHKLSASAGPLALIPDTGGDPLLIHSAADPATLLAKWEN